MPKPYSLFSYAVACAALSESVQAVYNSSHHDPTVTIHNGKIKGLYNPSLHQESFLGIPYAQPPVGHSRFARPEPLNSTWSTPFAANDYGKFCHGTSLNLEGFDQEGITYPEDEDCLTLNIVRPSTNNDSSRLPVLVWIYGGGFQEGGSGDARYNMSSLVQQSVAMEKPIIGVSLNYRVSVLGFPSGQVFREQGLTNLGLHDQRLALHWIQENIEAFGGDSSRVTIQGESAGAGSVGFHLLGSGHGTGLFQGAIAQSGGPFHYMPFASYEVQDSLLETLVNTTGCSFASDTLSCLKSVPASVLMQASANVTWSPVLDGDLLTQPNSIALRKAEFVQVPLLIGSNTNEGTPLVPSFSSIAANNSGDFTAALTQFNAGRAISAEATSRFQDLYLDLKPEALQKELGTVLPDPGESYGSVYGSVSLLLGDLLFTAGRRIAAEAWARNGVDAYSYRFDTVPAGVDPTTMGACHFSEVAFVFHNTEGGGYENDPFDIRDISLRQKYLDLSNLMSRMWISFVNTGSPNHHGVPGFPTFWPKYSNIQPQNMVFNAKDGVTLEPDNYRTEGITLIGDMAGAQGRK
ncbi:hypothetical protein LCI18_012337 [Fusarium solani-melongenae]|uniref:Uncharacterized protein n=1 Tax=Fusarium solani subsp. cucurbitae TaxID=2747967 RepID=A0ACD3ZJI6_FUSSC|nr:hypothetical protein LCI18_012337 [Fusarium solani-melongenae]